MKSIVFACLLAVVSARPDSRYGAPSHGVQRSFNNVEILRDDRIHPDGGSYSFAVETEDGIHRSEKGSPLDIKGNPTGQYGDVSFTLPNGQKFELSFVADENGFQPKSPFLPVGPEIPAFALEQIEKAAREDAQGSRSVSGSAPSGRYSYSRK